MINLKEARDKGFTTSVAVEKADGLTCIVLCVFDKGNLKYEGKSFLADKDVELLKQNLG